MNNFIYDMAPIRKELSSIAATITCHITSMHPAARKCSWIDLVRTYVAFCTTPLFTHPKLTPSQYLFSTRDNDTMTL